MIDFRYTGCDHLSVILNTRILMVGCVGVRTRAFSRDDALGRSGGFDRRLASSDFANAETSEPS